MKNQYILAPSEEDSMEDSHTYLKRPSKRNHLYGALFGLFLLIAIVGSSSNLREKTNFQTGEKISIINKAFGHGKICDRYDFKCKADEAFTNFEALTASQSTTVEQAMKEYKKRYNRQPPSRFQEWAQFAIQHNSTLLDEFDRIEADLRPFRYFKLTKKQLFDRMSSAWDSHRFIAQESYFLGYINIKDGKLQLGGHQREDFTYQMSKILSEIASRLPDLTLLYNWIDEPGLVLPSDNNVEESDQVFWEDFSHESTWDILRRPCSSSILKSDPWKFPLSHEKDLCKSPMRTANQHGLFRSPSNFHASQTLFPMISSCKASTMGDILGPSASYFTEQYRMWTKPDTIPFEKKKKSVYWRGSSTGMIMLHKHWTEGQRQRFAMQMKRLKEGVEAAKKEGEQTTIEEQNRLWPQWFQETDLGAKMMSQLKSIPDEVSEVGFNAIFHCDKETCDEAFHFLPILPEDAVEKSFDYQIVADLDGEGMSGRFYRLVASQAVPLKQTVWHEWHDGRLFPWVHYIPLSLEMDELYPLLTWLLGSSEGQEYGAKIAKAGSDFAASSLRPIDASIYLYRLLLEYDGLFDTK